LEAIKAICFIQIMAVNYGIILYFRMEVIHL